MELLKNLSATRCETQQRASTREQVESHFVEIYPAIFRYLVISGSAPSDAEDILQETFLRLYSQMLQDKTPHNLKNWLFRVAYNIRIDRIRTGAAERLMSDLEWRECRECMADSSGDAETAMLQSEKTVQLQQALNGLTTRQAEYLALRAEGLTYREIGEIHGVAIATVAEACGHALQKLSRSCRAK